MNEPRIKLVPFDKIRLGTERAYLVKNVIPRVGLTVIWGPPKSGKSFWTFDLVMHAALGWEYRGRRVHQGPVVYCAFEGQSGIKARVEAFRQRHLAEHADAVPFYIVPAIIDLAKDHAELIKAIGTETDHPVAVVLDTLNRSLSGSEGKDEDMAAYIKAADAIRETFGCAVIIVHHCGVNESRPRGHTSLTGAADAQLAVKRDPAGIITVSIEWMKDGSGEGDVVASKLESVEVGIDEDGDPITSCIVLPAEVPEGAKAQRKGKSMAKGAKIALIALQQAIEEAGQTPPASNHIPKSARVVTVNLWKEYACSRGIAGEGTTEDAKRKAFTRAMVALLAEGLACNWQDHCWLA
jgi:AAA domain